MKYTIDITNIVKVIVENLPKDQFGVVTCYLGTIGAGLVVYKLKLDHDYKMAELNMA